MKLGEAIDLVICALDGDVEGKCYAATEAIYHLVGGKGAGLKAMVTHIPSGYKHATHWFLRGPHGEIIDLTAGQYDKILDYSNAKGCGLRTSGPSKFARDLLHNYNEKRLSALLFSRGEVL